MSLERATLYGLVIYSGRRVAFARVECKAAREIFIREGAGGGPVGNASCPSWPPTRSWCAQVEELEHKSRRQDVLVDEELIYAFYDKLSSRATCAAAPASSAGTARPAADSRDLLKLTRDELMRHEAAGITTEAFPQTIRLGGVDCAAAYLHEPGDIARWHHGDACRCSC